MASAENTRLRQDMMNKLRKARAEKAKTMSTNDDPLFNESTPESNSDSTTLDRLFYSQVFEGGKDYIESTGKPDLDITSLVYAESDWSEADQAQIPVLDEYYVWQHQVLYPLVMSQLAGLKCLTVGSTGTGKSTLHQNLAAVYKQPFYRLGGRGDMESDTIIGRVAVKDGETTFQLGEFAKAFRDGYYILLDEQWKLPSSINMTLQRVLEKGGILQIDDMDGDLCDKQIHKHSRTLIELADNVVGTGDGSDKYNATMIQDASTLNRVDLVLEVPYLKSSIEMGMLMRRFPVIPDDQAKKAVQVANLIRQAYDKDQVSATLSPRNLCAWMELAYKSKSYEESFKWTMLSRYADEQEKATVRGFWATVYGEELG